MPSSPPLRIPAGRIRGAVCFSLMVLNSATCCVPLFLLALVKLAVPLRPVRASLRRALTGVAEVWIAVNTRLLALTQSIEWRVSGLDGLEPLSWYLVIANHRSWVDILALQAVCNRRIPFLKFFLKEQLRWVPVMGLAWWALDMPFMKRYSRAEIERHPELRGADLATTRRACERFREIPTSVINFVEGTRFTAAKHAASRSPYRHLLPPRAGGVAFVIAAMGGTFKELLDVTIAYPRGGGGLWALCCGRVPAVVIEISRRPLEPWLAAGDYASDPAFRSRFQEWLAELWSTKDSRLARLLPEPGSERPPAPDARA